MKTILADMEISKMCPAQLSIQGKKVKGWMKNGLDSWKKFSLVFVGLFLLVAALLKTFGGAEVGPFSPSLSFFAIYVELIVGFFW